MPVSGTKAELISRLTEADGSSEQHKPEESVWKQEEEQEKEEEPAPKKAKTAGTRSPERYQQLFAAECFKQLFAAMVVEKVHPNLPFAKVHNVNLSAVAKLLREAEQCNGDNGTRHNAGSQHVEKTFQSLMQIHGALVFPKQQQLEERPEDLVILNKVFGYHSNTALGHNFGFDLKTAATVDGFPPEVQVQGNAKAGSQPTGFTAEGFHSDALHEQQTQLPVITSMLCLKACTQGGETLSKCGR